jgi:hypothetical protein
MTSHVCFIEYQSTPFQGRETPKYSNQGRKKKKHTHVRVMTRNIKENKDKEDESSMPRDKKSLRSRKICDANT